MEDTQRSIFRREAVRRYIEGKEKIVLPRLVAPHTFAYLWFLLGLLGVSCLIAWFTRVPVYATGSAVVIRWKDRSTKEGIVVAAFFSPQHLSSLQVAQKLFLRFEASDRLSRAILTVESEIISPDAIQKQFALNSQIAQKITQPAAVVIAQLEPLPVVPASAYLGSIGRAEIEVGSQRVVSLLPLIGHFFEK